MELVIEATSYVLYDVCAAPDGVSQSVPGLRTSTLADREHNRSQAGHLAGSLEGSVLSYGEEERMKFRRRHPVTLGLGLLISAFLVGACGGGSDSSGTSSKDDGPAVAQVGERSITKGYYETRLQKMDRTFLPDTLDMAGKRKFLDFIINKELMALKAEEMGLADEPDIIRTLKLIQDNLVYGRATERISEGRIDASDVEIEQFYKNSQTQVLCKHILVATETEADIVYKKLREGADFDQLVREFTTVPAEDAGGEPITVTQRAIFGWIEYGKTQPWIEKAVFGGELSIPLEPLRTAYGWHVFMPIEHQTKRQQPLSEMRDLIAKQISLRKKRVLVEAYYRSILDEHGFDLEETSVDLVYKMLPEDVDPRERPDASTEIKPVIPFSIADRTKLLFRLDGKKYSIGDFSDQYDESSWFERPKRNFGSQGLYYWIRNGWLKPLQMEQAYADGVDRDESVVEEVERRREQMMVNYLHTSLIGSQVPDFTEEQMVAFYESHLDVYVDKEKRIFNLIYHPRERVVRRAYKLIQDGADFVETAINFSDNATEPHHVQTPAFARDDEDFKEIAEVGYALELKGISEPFKTENGWVLMQYFLGIAEKPFEFESIREFILRDLRNEWGEKRLNELLVEWKQQYKVEIFEDVLVNVEVRRDDVFVPGKSLSGAE